jgi:hypothetical protein
MREFQPGVQRAVKADEADDFDETCRSVGRRLSWILNAV